MSRRLTAILALTLILLLSFAARVAQLDAQSLWYDETVSLYTAQQPIGHVIAYATGDVHPPLYNLLLHSWITVAGPSEFAARFMSVMLGMLMVALGFRLARDWFGYGVGLLTAALIGASSFNLWYSQEARMYVLAAAGALLSLILFARIALPRFNAGDHRTRGLALAYAGTLALSLYAHYYLVFLWVFEYVWGVIPLLADGWRARRAWRAGNSIVWQRLRDWHLLHLLILVLFAPWLPVMVRQTVEPPVPPWRTWVDPLTALAESLRALAVGQLQSTQAIEPIVLALALVYGLAIVRAGADRMRRLFLVCAAFVPIMLVLIGSLVTPLYYVRYVVIYGAAFYIVLAVGIAAVWRRSRPLALAVLALYAVGAWYAEDQRRFNEDDAKDGYRRAIAFLSARVRPGDAILINAGFTHTAFDYYYAEPTGWRGRLADYRGDEHADDVLVALTGSLEGSASLGWGDPSADFYLTNEPSTAHALGLILSRHTRLWVLQSYDRMTDPKGFLRRYLTEHATQFEELSVPGLHTVRVQGYLSHEASPTLDAASASTRVAFGRQLALVSSTSPATTTAGSLAKLSLLWEPLVTMQVDYRYSLGMYDERGRRWAQADGHLVGSQYPTSQWIALSTLPASVQLAVPDGTPPGDYELRLTVYDPATRAELRVSNETTQARLGRLRVERAAGAVTPWDALPLQSEAVFGGWLALQRHTPLPAQARPGDALSIEVLWRALQSPLPDVTISLQLRDASGRLVAQRASVPVDGAYPTSDWAAGEEVRDPRTLPIPANLADGHYTVSLAASQGAAHMPVRAAWSLVPADGYDLGTLELQGRTHTMQRPASIGTAVASAFGGIAELAGYEAQASAGNPRELAVTLYWRALGQTDTDYKVFLHLIGPDGRIAAQSDGEPGGGTLRTTSWITGEYLTDRHVVPIGGVAPGTYVLRVGMYDPAGGVRLPAVASDDRPAGDYWDMHGITLP